MAAEAGRTRGARGGYALGASDEILGTFVPIAVYWIYSGLYALLPCLCRGLEERYRMHSRKDERARNVISKPEVVRGVLLQQAVQVAASLALFAVAGGNEAEEQPAAATAAFLLSVGKQFLVAMVVMDTWQYFLHRLMHHNRFLYRHVHSKHHRLVVPYSFGALYNHPAEGLLGDTLGGALSFLLSGMSPRTSIYFFSFATIKTVDDHCGLWLPGNPFHWLFRNNTAYHDIHHQLYGTKYNFSQPFFVTWDRILGTYMPYAVERRPDGAGFQARPIARGTTTGTRPEQGSLLIKSEMSNLTTEGDQLDLKSM